MVNLDSFHEFSGEKSITCSECGTEQGGVSFWTTEDTGCDPDLSLCIRCLLRAEGRYNQSPPEEIARSFESVESIEEQHDTVVVTAKSHLGEVQYVHHTESAAHVVDDARRPDREVFQLRKGRQLTGDVEAFDANGVFLAAVSPYFDVVSDYVTVS